MAFLSSSTLITVETRPGQRQNRFQIQPGVENDFAWTMPDEVHIWRRQERMDYPGIHGIAVTECMKYGSQARTVGVELP